ALMQRPAGPREPRLRAAPADAHEEQPADAKPDGDKAWKPRRAQFLARHRRESLDMPEDDAGEDDERGARQRIVDLYLASPTAFSAAPRFVSESAMNFVVPAGSAHTTPKPRLAMKSLYSLESYTFFSALTSVRCASAGMPLGAAMTRHAAICQFVPSSFLSVGTFG